MPTQPKPQINAWSFSRWATYQKCPFKLKCQAIDRIPEKKGPALIRGQEIHDEAENFVKGRLRTMPNSLRNFREEFNKLKKRYKDGTCKAEDMLCFDKNWNYMPGAKFEPSIWCRIKKDATILLPEERHAILVDYKTGKVQPEPYWEQMDLYGLGTLLTEDVDSVSVQLWFLDHGVIQPDEADIEYTQDDVPRLKKEWNSRTKKMLSDRRFDPKPGDECRWCSFAASKGGPCKKG